MKILEITTDKPKLSKKNQSLGTGGTCLSSNLHVNRRSRKRGQREWDRDSI